eukprot:3263343-Rhodomonas_salina.3
MKQEQKVRKTSLRSETANANLTKFNVRKEPNEVEKPEPGHLGWQGVWRKQNANLSTICVIVRACEVEGSDVFSDESEAIYDEG